MEEMHGLEAHEIDRPGQFLQTGLRDITPAKYGPIVRRLMGSKASESKLEVAAFNSSI